MIFKFVFAAFSVACIFVQQLAALDTSLGEGSQDIVTWDKV
jgi:hypothetical protein